MQQTENKSRRNGLTVSGGLRCGDRCVGDRSEYTSEPHSISDDTAISRSNDPRTVSMKLPVVVHEDPD